MLEAFIIPVVIAFVAEIVHSTLTKGWKFTLEFFAGGFLFGFVRELIAASYLKQYGFPDMPIQFLNVPIFIPVGWVFTFYLAYEFTNKIIKPSTEANCRTFIIFAAFFSTCICIPIETAAMNMNWWWVVLSDTSGNIAVFHLMRGWLYTTMVFFYIYFVAKKNLSLKQLMLAFVLVIIFCMWELNIYIRSFLIMLVIFTVYKEIAVVLMAYAVAEYCGMMSILFFIPNWIFVTILFVFNFTFILVKLHSREAKHQFSTV